MKVRLIVGERVKSFLESLAPEPRRKLWRAIKELSEEKGDTRQLEGKLAPYWRLRVDRMRVIYDQRAMKGERILVCFFPDYRATVYSVLEQLLSSGLIAELTDASGKEGGRSKLSQREDKEGPPGTRRVRKGEDQD
jgi:mRNA-degrading endonuclease RelE of RelBE toxin-antitoxin system